MHSIYTNKYIKFVAVITFYSVIVGAPPIASILSTKTSNLSYAEINIDTQNKNNDKNLSPQPTSQPTSVLQPTKRPEPTATPTCTPTPVVIIHNPIDYPTNTPQPTENPTPTIVSPTTVPVENNGSNGDQNVTQNANPVINITNNNNPNLSNNNDIAINNAPATQEVLGATTQLAVAPAVQTSQLPSTGAESNILFGLLSMIPAGLGIRKFSKIK